MKLAILLLLSLANIVTAKSLSVIDFGAIPNDNINDRDQINRAIEYCKTEGIKELKFPAGNYILESKMAISLMNDVMDLKMGTDPEKTIFTPYYRYERGVKISDIDNLSLIGDSAKFICNGWMEPISIIDSQNITISGITIDYKRQPHSEGEIINITDRYFDVKFSETYPVKSDMVMPRIMFYSKTKDRLESYPIYFPKQNRLIANQTLRIWDKLPQSYIGDIALINHSFHFRPAILILNSSDIDILDTYIHSQPGMGIVGHRSNNITMHNLNIVPRDGSKMSTNTDATHFISSTGFIKFKDCNFEGHGDDATNVHNYYYTIKEKIGDGYVTTVDAPTGTHAQLLDYPDIGDKMELVSDATLKVIKTVVVKSVKQYPNRWETVLTFNEELPKELKNYKLINITRVPKLRMDGCNVKNHLARAVLIKTRDVIIENCTFIGSTGTAIHIGAEGEWHEGPGSSDVIVRNNSFVDCGHGDGAQNKASAIAVNVKSSTPPKDSVHFRLSFQNNSIVGRNSKYGIFVTGATDISIKNNSFSNCIINSFIDR